MSVLAPWDCFKGFEYPLKVLKILHAYITTDTLPDFPLPDFLTRLYNVCMISQNVLDHVLERFRSLFNGFEHSKLYVDCIGRMDICQGLTTVLNHPLEIKKVPNGPLLPLNQFNIIGLPCKISKYYNWGILRKNYFCVLQWGYFHPAIHFQRVFGRYL